MDISSEVLGCLRYVEDVMSGIGKEPKAAGEENERLGWVCRQLHSMVWYLQSLLIDFESGVPLSDQGITMEDLEDILCGIREQVSTLESMVRMMRGIGR